MVTLVQATNEYHVVGILGSRHGVGDQLFRRTALAKILTCRHPVELAAGITDITTLVNHLRIREPFPDSLQRGNLVLDFQRGTSAAHCHHLDSVLADNQNLPRVLYRKNAAIVPEKHDGLRADLSRRRDVFRADERAERTVPVHHRAEHKSQDPADLVVKHIHGIFPFIDSLEERIRKVVVGVSV